MSKRQSMWLGLCLVAAAAVAACVEEPSEVAAPEVGSTVDELVVTSATPGCFKTVTWVPTTPPSATCACDPYNPCESTLLSEQCTPFTPTGPAMTRSYWISIICPNLEFGTQLVTITTQTHSAFCTISYQCNHSTLPCISTGTKYIKKRNVTYGPPICPVE